MAERRNFFTEKEIPIHVPQAPPRTKRTNSHKRQSFKDFREEHRNRKQTLFQSEHQTDEGADLLPVGKRIAFDCPADPNIRESEIYVGIKGKTDIQLETHYFAELRHVFFKPFGARGYIGSSGTGRDIDLGLELLHWNRLYAYIPI